MSTEDQEFIRGALSAMTEDVVKSLKVPRVRCVHSAEREHCSAQETIAKLMKSESTEDDRIDAFDSLMDYIEDIDLAKDVCLLGLHVFVFQSVYPPG
jgi:hypothetical protein